MALFKSREERRIEREMTARRALANFRRQIAQQEKHEKGYIKKAIRAKQLGDPRLLGTLKKNIRRTQVMRYRFERGLLLLETAMQSKDQIESFESFGKGMAAITKSIEQSYGVTNLVKTQKDYEMAMSKAESMEQRIDLFLESALDSGAEISEDEAEAAMSDADLDRLIDERAVKAEDVGADDEIEKGLAEIERELGKE